MRAALTVLIPAAVGVGAGLLLAAHAAPLRAALASSGAGYAALFARKYGIAEAFCAATAVTRSDIALIFASLLISGAERVRPPAAAVSFFRALTSSLALSAVASSSAFAFAFAIAFASLLIGAFAAEYYLFYICGSRSRPRRVYGAAVAVGALIAARTVLFLIGHTG